MKKWQQTSSRDTHIVTVSFCYAGFLQAFSAWSEQNALMKSYIADENIANTYVKLAHIWSLFVIVLQCCALTSHLFIIASIFRSDAWRWPVLYLLYFPIVTHWHFFCAGLMPEDEEEEPNENLRCVVCMVHRKNATIVHGTTGHICCCMQCALILKSKGDKCPICRAPIDNVIRHYTS